MAHNEMNVEVDGRELKLITSFFFFFLKRKSES